MVAIEAVGVKVTLTGGNWAEVAAGTGVSKWEERRVYEQCGWTSNQTANPYIL
jgi:hypothetical protein